MTAGDVTAAVRRELNDEEPGMYRWPDTVMFDYLTDALHDARKLRPDLFLGANGMASVTQVSALGNPLPVGEDVKRALSAYVMARCLAEDGSDDANTTAAAGYMERYIGTLVGGAGT